MDVRLEQLLARCAAAGASDLHVSSGDLAYVRVHGELSPAGEAAIAPEHAEAMIFSLLDADQADAFARTGEADVAFSAGGQRFRGHVFRDKAGPALAARRLEDRFRPLGELNLPDSLAELSELRDGLVLDDDLVKRIKQTIRDNTTPRHVPAKVLQVADIPRTKSGKIVELAVRNVVHGRPVKNREALANPEALAHFCDRAELAG